MNLNFIKRLFINDDYSKLGFQPISQIDFIDFPRKKFQIKKKLVINQMFYIISLPFGAVPKTFYRFDARIVIFIHVIILIAFRSMTLVMAMHSTSS